MADNFRDDDLKTAWQQQPIEESKMTLEKIEEKARELRAKTQRELWGNIGLGAIVLGIAGWGFMLTHETGLRLLFTAAILWMLAGQYFVHRGMWSATLPGDAALRTGLEFYRREIERRSNIFRHVVQWSFGPVVLAIGALILVLTGIAKNQAVPLGRVMPFCLLVAAWIGAFFLLRSRTRGEIRREIEELHALERDRRR